MPSAALGMAAGGEIATDPGDASGLRAFEQTFLIDVAPVGLEPGDIWTGERAYVRFDHGYEPEGWRLLRELRQLFMRRLDV
jgi:putative peptide zinc metalloprotease protein